MLMLIPLALISLLTVILLTNAQAESQRAEASELGAAVRAVEFHHSLVLSQPILASGVIETPAGSMFTALEGLTSYAHIEDGSIFVLTWPERYDVSSGIEGQNSIHAGQRHSEEVANNTILRGGRALANSMTNPGFTSYGLLTRSEGAFDLRVGPVMIPFDPPVALRAPIILTILSGA